MRRDQREHAIRAECQIAGLTEVIIVGSQAILGTYREQQLPFYATRSAEIDVLPIADTAGEIVSPARRARPGPGCILGSFDKAVAVISNILNLKPFGQHLLIFTHEALKKVATALYELIPTSGEDTARLQRVHGDVLARYNELGGPSD
jgi:hypothetical protein